MAGAVTSSSAEGLVVFAGSGDRTQCSRLGCEPLTEAGLGACRVGGFSDNQPPQSGVQTADAGRQPPQDRWSKDTVTVPLAFVVA